ncbi:hypothetical protein LP037_028 [Listeria phage LP-037]|uniref:Uncharacterized protein n=1 Tax=Listeria phage LP-037 TaxID=1173747 RepID=S4UAA0_9CAUD|nr:hypothetical protein LP037_028 [Listeria phage LP-037]AGI11643.1 hypothetical protein LP037_028 [Listeria phage LP-037]
MTKFNPLDNFNKKSVDKDWDKLNEYIQEDAENYESDLDDLINNSQGLLKDSDTNIIYKGNVHDEFQVKEGHLSKSQGEEDSSTVFDEITEKLKEMASVADSRNIKSNELMEFVLAYRNSFGERLVDLAMQHFPEPENMKDTDKTFLMVAGATVEGLVQGIMNILVADKDFKAEYGDKYGDNIAKEIHSQWSEEINGVTIEEEDEEEELSGDIMQLLKNLLEGDK